MGKRMNPGVVGAFVVGAVVLAVVGVAVFGSGRLFRRTQPYVLYFSGDVNGLNVGAPVKFKGVEIGTVKNVLLSVSAMARLDGDEEDVRIPVIIELDEGNLAQKGAKVRPDPETIKRLVDRGLRAQLSMESFVTGLLYIKLDFYPKSPLRLVDDPTVSIPEIPTIPTPLEEVQTRASQLLARIEETDFAGLIESLRGALDGADKLLNSPDLAATVAALDEAVGNVNTTVTNLNETVTSYRTLAKDASTQVNAAGESLRSVSRGATSTMQSAGTTLDSATETLDGVRTFLRPDSPVFYKLGQTLDDLSVAARAIRRLAEDLERNPSVLVRGKAVAEEKR